MYNARGGGASLSASAPAAALVPQGGLLRFAAALAYYGRERARAGTERRFVPIMCNDAGVRFPLLVRRARSLRPGWAREPRCARHTKETPLCN